jgi:hypothetical protein
MTVRYHFTCVLKALQAVLESAFAFLHCSSGGMGTLASWLDVSRKPAIAIAASNLFGKGNDRRNAAGPATQCRHALTEELAA